MPELPRKKVGLIACSGEEIAEGTLTRAAVRLVLERLGSDRAVTICLPLFLSGDAGERQFAKTHPTITVDGCEKRCARVATEALSGTVSESLVVSDLLKAWGEEPPASRRDLGPRGWDLASRLADHIAAGVERLPGGVAPLGLLSLDIGLPAAPACSCMGGGLARVTLEVGGRRLDLLALDAAMTAVEEKPDLSPEARLDELLRFLRVYNGPLDDVPAEALRQALGEAWERRQRGRMGAR